MQLSSSPIRATCPNHLILEIKCINVLNGNAYRHQHNISSQGISFRISSALVCDMMLSGLLDT
jgi:hypothetical protein